MPRRTSHVFSLVLCSCILTASADAGAQVVQYGWAFNYAQLGVAPADGDLLENKDIIVFGGAAFEAGLVDPVNGVESWAFAGEPDRCTEVYDGVEDPDQVPNPGFWHALGDPSPEANFPLLTDGTLGLFAAVLRDFSRAALVARYDFDTPKDIGEIRVLSRQTGRDVRVFQHYDVYASTDGGLTYAPLALGVKNGAFGDENILYVVSYTRVTSSAAVALATGVTNLRFVFYCVGLPGAMFVDPWRGYANEQDADFVTRCQPVYPADPRDTDGRKQAFVGTFVDEIDVFPPALPGDGDADGDVDLADFTGFAGCLTGPGPAQLAPTCWAYDLPPRDGDVDLADYAALMRQFE